MSEVRQYELTADWWLCYLAHTLCTHVASLKKWMNGNGNVSIKFSEQSGSMLLLYWKSTMSCDQISSQRKRSPYWKGQNNYVDQRWISVSESLACAGRGRIWLEKSQLWSHPQDVTCIAVSWSGRTTSKCHQEETGSHYLQHWSFLLANSQRMARLLVIWKEKRTPYVSELICYECLSNTLSYAAD